MAKTLTCDICGQRKSVGIMTAQAWGVVNGGSHPACACPSCQEKHYDWRDRLTRLVNESG